VKLDGIVSGMMDGGIFCEFSSQYQWCNQDEQVM